MTPDEADWRVCGCGCGIDAYDFNEWVHTQRDMWRVEYEPRSTGDKKPWRLVCPLKMPTTYYYDQGWRCYCRQRFRTEVAGERWIARRIFGEDEKIDE